MKWEQLRLDRLATPVNLTIDPSALGDELVDHFSIPALDATGGPAVEPGSSIESNKQPVFGGEVLISKLNPRKARVVLVPQSSSRRMLVSGEFIVLEPTGIDPRLLRYLLLAESTRQTLDAAVNSVTRSHQRVRPEVLTKLVVSAPGTAAGQRAIADYLDVETARIDALIAKKQQLIHLLEERLASSAEHLLSGAVSACPDRAPSHAPGFGEIPTSWGVRSIGSMFELGRGRVISHDDIQENPGPYPVYSSQSLNDGSMGSLDSYDFEGEYLTWTTDGAHAGTVFHRTGRFNCTNVCGTLQANGDISHEYVRFALTQATRWFVRHDINPKLMNDVMASIRVPVPPVDEQVSIVAQLNVQVRHRDRMAVLLARQIELLTERRQALITTAVTGEFTVPGAP